jgi:thioredoxin:protein disulfide reductase
MDFNTAIHHSIGLAYIVVFLGGLLTALTPCVFPLIPITVSIFGAKKTKTKTESALLSGLYVIGIAVTYTGLGLLAAVTGTAFGSVMGNRWIVTAVAALFVAFSLAMFDLIEIAVPSRVLGRVSRVGGEGRVGAFGMGAVAGIIAAPCTGPILAAVLTFAATTQKLFLGGSLLFVYAIGIGLPFFIVGTFAVSLPKSGTWMETVKRIFGIVMLVVAWYFLQDAFEILKVPVLNTSASRMYAAGTAVLCLAVYVSMELRSKDYRFVKILLGACVVVFAHLAITSTIRSEIPTYTAEQWSSQGKTVLAQAQKAHKPVMIDFSASWCAACRELARDTFPSPKVAAELRRFTFVRVDDEQATAVQRYGGEGLPYIVFFDTRGRLLQLRAITGFRPPDELLAVLQSIN